MKTKSADFELEIRPIDSNSHDAITVYNGAVAAELCLEKAVEWGVVCGVYCKNELIMYSMGVFPRTILGSCVSN